jgi:hypothetical protein
LALPDGYFPATKNVIDHVIIDGGSAAGGTWSNRIEYGVLFDSNGSDAPAINNDLSTIRDTIITHVTKAAIKLHGANSYAHLFQRITGYGPVLADGSLDTSYTTTNFIESDFGDYTADTTFAGGFLGAVFHIQSNFEPIVIINTTSEGCGRLIESPVPGLTPPQLNGHGVQIIGGRFGMDDNLNSDGHMVDWHNYENLSISNLFIQGNLPSEPVKPKLIYYDPHFDSVNDSLTGSEAGLRLEGLHLFFNNGDSSSWDPVYVSDRGRIESSENFCMDFLSNHGNHPCLGLLGGVKWNDAHTLEDLRDIDSPNLAAGHSAYCSDCTANSSPCQGGGGGSMAVRIGADWDCSGFSSQSAHAFLVGPTSGGPATPTFRTIGDSDVPDDLTASNYLPLAGGTLTGNVAAGSGVTLDGVDIGLHDHSSSTGQTRLAAKDRRRLCEHSLPAITAAGEWTIGMAPAEAITHIKAWLVPDAAYTANTNNYWTLTIYRRDSAGANPTVLYSINTKLSANGGTGSWTAYKPISFGTVSNAAQAADGTFTIGIVKSGGANAPGGKIVVEYTVD